MICVSGKVCLGAQTSAWVLRRSLASVRRPGGGRAAEVIIVEALVKAAVGMAASSDV